MKRADLIFITIKNVKILITGAGGLVGKEFIRQFTSKYNVSAFTRSELDITDEAKVNRIIRQTKPEIIINCAVLGIEACEKNPSAAYSVNVKGTENLAKAAEEVNAEFVQISTNYVFDGNRQNGKDFYTIKDIPAPLNIYGKTKYEGEQIALASSKKCYIVRTSWVFGKDKESFFSQTPRLLKERKKVFAASDAYANTTYVYDLVSRITEIIKLKNYGIYHVVNSGICSRFEFALEAGRILNISENELKKLIFPVTKSDTNNSIKRPLHTPMVCLNSEKIGLAPMRDWRIALGDFIS